MMKKTSIVLICFFAIVSYAGHWDLSFYLPQFLFNGINYLWNSNNDTEQLYFNMGVASKVYFGRNTIDFDFSFQPPIYLVVEGRGLFGKVDIEVYNLDINYSYDIVDTDRYALGLGAGYNYRYYNYFSKEQNLSDILLEKDSIYILINNILSFTYNNNYIISVYLEQTIGYNDNIDGITRIYATDRRINYDPGDVTATFGIELFYGHNIFDARYYTLLNILL